MSIASDLNALHERLERLEGVSPAPAKDPAEPARLDALEVGLAEVRAKLDEIIAAIGDLSLNKAPVEQQDAPEASVS